MITEDAFIPKMIRDVSDHKDIGADSISMYYM